MIGSFFGLTSEYMEEGVYNVMFMLRHYSNFDETKVYHQPVALRQYWFDKLIELKEKEAETYDS